MNQNHFEHNSNYSGFDQPPQYSIDHQEDLNQQKISDVHDRWDKIDESQNELLNMMQSFCEMIKDYRNEKIDIRYRRECETMIDELTGKFNGMNELIKSSVEDLIPIPSESEDTFDSDKEYDLPFCDNSVTFYNPFFDANEIFTSKNIESKDSYVSNLDEPALLVTPLSDAKEDECFDPGSDVDEIELLLHHNPSTPKINVASILEGFTDEPPLEENDDLFDLESKDNEWKKILYDAPIDDLMT
ncbi:hypothetical protein Tco_0349190 [Tanacetum coccineum]